MKRCQNKSNIETVKDYLAGNRPFIQFGYDANLTPRVEGEVWEVAGKKWTMKNGKKQPLVNSGRFIIRMDCSDCKMNIKLFGNKSDNKMYAKTGRCVDCQVKYEGVLKRNGKFESYEKIKIFNNQKSYCLEMKVKLEDTIKTLENRDNTLKFMNEDGSYDVWPDTQRERILDGAKSELKECMESLDRIESQLKELNGTTTTN